MKHFVKPLLEATQNTFAMMLQQNVRFSAPTASSDPSAHIVVSAVIGLSGDITGAVAVRFATPVALAVAKKFSGIDVALGSEDLTDAIGEIANMIAGSAKSEFTGFDVSISCPTVISGEGHTIQSTSDSTCVSIPCKTDLGEFTVEIAIAARKPAQVAQ